MKWLLLFVFMMVLSVTAQVPAIHPPRVPFSDSVGPGGKFPFFNGGSIQMSDSDHTMGWPEFAASVIRLEGTLTNTRTLIAPSDEFGFEFTVQNATTGGQAVLVKGATGTGVLIPDGQVMTVLFDGTNYVAASSGGGAGGGGTWSIVNNVNTSVIPANVHDLISVGDPAPLSILTTATGAIGGTCGNNTLNAVPGQWAIACNSANEIIIPNSVNVGGLKVNGSWSVSNTYSMSTTIGAVVVDEVMATPAQDADYYLTWQLQQLDTGSGGTCNAGAFGVTLQFSPTPSGAELSPQLMGHPLGTGPSSNNFPAGTAVTEANYYVGVPFDFTVKGGTSVHFKLMQLTASNCSTPQQFVLRAHLKPW